MKTLPNCLALPILALVLFVSSRTLAGEADMVQRGQSPLSQPELLAFSRTETGTSSICVLPMRGQRTTVLHSSKTEKLSRPVVCTTQRFAVFASDDNRLHRVSLDGTGYRVLATFPKGDRWLAFDLSPDGRQAVVALCASNSAKADGLYLVNTLSGQKDQLTSEDCYAPRFSPDGKRVAFESSRDGHYQVFVMNLADKKRIKLFVKEEDTTYGACWSPDGAWIAFHDSHDELLIGDVSTGKCNRITRMAEGSFCYAFSRSGKQLAFKSEDGISTVPVDGGKPTVLAKAPSDVSMIEWSPDGKAVVFDQWTIKSDGSEARSYKAVDAEKKTVWVLTEW